MKGKSINIENDNSVIEISIELVKPNDGHREEFLDDDELNELVDSIKEYGLLHPLVVQEKEGYYEIKFGARRWRAARIAGLKVVPCRVVDYSDEELDGAE